MENWTNLNKILQLSGKDLDKKAKDSQKIIELTQAGKKSEIVNLLKEGATLNCYADMTTPLIEAVRNDNEELTDYFLKVGATINFKPSEEIQDAFWEVLLNKKYNFLKRFINKKCIISRGKDKEIALVWATKESDVETVEILLSHYNIKVNERDSDGNTALHHNVSKSPHTDDDIMIGKMLIAAGADVNGTNFENQTPEDLATDFNAKTALMHSKLEQRLPEKEKSFEEESTIDNPGIHKTKNNKLKI